MYLLLTVPAQETQFLRARENYGERQETTRKLVAGAQDREWKVLETFKASLPQPALSLGKVS